MGILDKLIEMKAGLKAKEASLYQQLVGPILQQQQLQQLKMQADFADRQQAGQYAKQAAQLKPMLSRYGGEFAQEVGSGLLSDSPEVRAMAAAKLQDADMKRGIAPQSAYAALQGQVLGNTAQALGITQGQQEFPQRLKLLEAQTAAANRANQPVPASATPPSIDPGGLYKQMTGSEVPSQFRAQFTSNGPRLVPVEGSTAWQNSVGAVRTAEGALARIQSMTDDFAEYGTEQLPTKTKGRMKANREALMADLAKLQNLGVIQPADYQRLSGMLPDPTDLTFIQTDEESIASLEFIEQEMEKALRNAYESNPWVEKGIISMPGAGGRW